MSNAPIKIVKKTRNTNFELLRIIAIILIILFHFVNHSPAIHTSPFCMNKVLAYFIGSWGIVGVHCFFFISAWFLQEKERFFNSFKLYAIFFQLIFYSIVFLTVGGLTEIISININTVNQSLIYWYIIAYVIMYVMSPFMNKFIDACHPKSIGKIVLILTIIFPLQYFIYPITRISDVDLAIYDYLLIAYLKKNDKNWFEKNRYIGFILTFITVLLAEFSILYLLRSVDLIDKFIGRYSIFQILLAIFIFYIFKNLTFKLKIINTLAKSTLAVYIFHEGVLSGFLRNQILDLDRVYLESYYIIYLLITSVLVFLIATFVDYFRKLIYDWINNKFMQSVTKVTNKINSWFIA